MQKKRINPGSLYIVATPIGNLQDITLRALEVLKSVDLIACEDTRHSQKLLNHYAIKKPLISLHEHNERTRSTSLIKKLQDGKDIALISDAGTPLICDPGFHLVREARSNEIDVIPIPGASAIITALSASGLPSDDFRFIGFLPSKKTVKTKLLQTLVDATETLICYETPHRLFTTLDAICEIFGSEREVVIAKELTKLHESFYSGSCEEVKKLFQEKNIRGEFVILIDGNKETKNDKSKCNSDEVLTILLAELPTKQAVKLTSKITGLASNKLYQKALKIKSVN